jgi:DNA repair protein RadC
MLIQTKEIGKTINKPSKIIKILNKLLSAEDLADQAKEHFWTIGVTAQNKIIYIDLTHLGTLDFSTAHPRDIFRQAITHGAFAIIVSHNHPSGDPKPSRDDHKKTKQLKLVGDFLEIPCLDHIILGKVHSYSFNSDEYFLN